jgi:hypothetical protein
MGKRIRNRMELREQYDAAARRETEEAAEETEETEEEDDDEEGDEEEEEEAGEEEAAGDDDEGGDDDDEDAPRPKKKPKKKPAPKAAPKAKPRSRAAKVVRKKLVWKVFNNSNNEVATYEYPKKKDAYDHAARLTTDKKQTHFVQPVKVDLEEKKEDGKK